MFTLLVPLGFVDLVVLDVFFYMAALMLEMAALISLRRKFARRDGLFVVRGGNPGVWLVATLPIVTWVATFGLALSRSDGRSAFLVASVLALGVWPAYALARRLYGGPSAA